MNYASHKNCRDWHRDANSASTRLQVEELTKQQSNAFPQLVLADLKDHVMVEAERDLAEALVTAKRKLNTYVPESEFKQACLVFDQKYVEVRVNGATLIEKRRPQKRKRSSEQHERPQLRNREVRSIIVITAVTAAGRRKQPAQGSD